MDVAVTPEFLASVAGIALSLIFSYIPGVKDWYNSLTGEWKRVVMAVLLLVVALALFGLGCAGIVHGISCDQSGIIRLVSVFIMALVANQSTYMLAGSRSRDWHVYTITDADDLPEM